VQTNVVFNYNLNEPRETAERRSGLSEFYINGTETKKALGAKIEVTVGLEKR